jgi:hypothetical protein
MISIRLDDTHNPDLEGNNIAQSAALCGKIIGEIASDGRFDSSRHSCL